MKPSTAAPSTAKRAGNLDRVTRRFAVALVMASLGGAAAFGLGCADDVASSGAKADAGMPDVAGSSGGAPGPGPGPTTDAALDLGSPPMEAPLVPPNCSA